MKKVGTEFQKEFEKHVGKTIKKARKKSAWSPEDIEKVLKITPSSLARLERGVFDPPPVSALQLLELSFLLSIQMEDYQVS